MREHSTNPADLEQDLEYLRDSLRYAADHLASIPQPQYAAQCRKAADLINQASRNRYRITWTTDADGTLYARPLQVDGTWTRHIAQAGEFPPLAALWIAQEYEQLPGVKGVEIAPVEEVPS